MDTRVGCYGWIDDGTRILLTHWRHPDGLGQGWTLPGGGMEPGETVVDAIVREVMEETGYRVVVDEILGTNSIHVPLGKRHDAATATRPYHSLQVIHRAHIVGGEFVVEVGGSTDDAGWFTPAEIDRLDTVRLVRAARRLVDR